MRRSVPAFGARIADYQTRLIAMSRAWSVVVNGSSIVLRERLRHQERRDQHGKPASPTWRNPLDYGRKSEPAGGV